MPTGIRIVLAAFLLFDTQHNKNYGKQQYYVQVWKEFLDH